MIKLRDILKEIGDSAIKSQLLNSEPMTIKGVEGFFPRIKSLFDSKKLFGEYVCDHCVVSGGSEDGKTIDIFIFLKSNENPEKKFVINLPVYGNLEIAPGYVQRHLKMSFKKPIDYISPKELTDKDSSILVDLYKLFYPKVSWSSSDLRFAKDSEEIGKYIVNPSSYKPKTEEPKTEPNVGTSSPQKKPGLFSRLKNRFGSSK